MTVKAVKKPRIKMIASVNCKGSLCNTNGKVLLEGVNSCVESIEKHERDDSCSYGCLGYGTCAEKCPFDAIDMIDGLAIVNEEKCKGCKLCVKACPRDVIDMIPAVQEVVVKCNSNEFGKVVKDVCKVGCIGCQMCVRVCPFFAMDFTNKLAHINYDNCTNCTLCAQKCPTKAIGGSTKRLGVASISEDRCIGCTVCAQVCPVDAIDGHREEVHMINEDICISCSYCTKKCPVNAITMTEFTNVKKPVSKTEEVKRYDKEVVRYLDNFDDFRNISETIEYEENIDSDYFNGSLSLYRASKLEDSNLFKVVYRGELESISK